MIAPILPNTMAFAKKKASAKADVLYIYITRWDKP